MNVYDVIIIGGGPGGYAAAAKAGQVGLKTALVEEELLGGTCVNWGCIPTKALLRYAKLRHSRASAGVSGISAPVEYGNAHSKSLKISKERREKIENLLSERQVTLFAGRARLISATEVEIQPSGETIKGKNIIIATGSRSRQIPGVEYDGVDIVTTRDALQLTKAPASAVIVGSGATGMEFATVWTRFGSKVTVLEMLPYIMGIDDSDISAHAEKYFTGEGMKIRTSVKAFL